MKKLVSVILHFTSAIEWIIFPHNISNCWSMWTLSPLSWEVGHSFAVGASSLHQGTWPPHESVSNTQEAWLHRSLFVPAWNLFLWDLCAPFLCLFPWLMDMFLSKKTFTSKQRLELAVFSTDYFVGGGNTAQSSTFVDKDLVNALNADIFPPRTALPGSGRSHRSRFRSGVLSDRQSLSLS